MPEIKVNGININYRIEGEGEETVVLVNGLADDLESWAFQTGDLLSAGYRVLSFDNRGVGLTDKPEGPYTSRLLADDTKALVDELGLRDFHLVGVSMGGMVAQEYALAYGEDIRSLVLACTYAAPGPFCSRMFAMWADLAPALGVPFVMRDVALWAFTVPFFEEREDELEEFEAEFASLTMTPEAYLSQLAAIRTHDATGRLAGIRPVPDPRPRRRRGHPDPRHALETPARGHPRLRMGDHQRRPRLPLGAPRTLQPGHPGVPRTPAHVIRFQKL